MSVWRLPRTLFLAATLVVAASPVFAQYFGPNKVQYGRFDFRILQTRHFDVYYYPEEQEGALHAARLAERWYARLANALQHELHGRQPLILYASHPDFTQTNIVEGSPGEGTGGLTEGGKNRIVMPFAVGLGETNHVLGHELVHAFQYDLAKHGHAGILSMPLWFIEGMAEYVTLGPDDGTTAMWMRDVVRQGTLPSIKELAGRRFFPYRYGHALWSYLAGRFGEDVVPRMLKAKGSTVKARLKAVTGLDEAQLTHDWHASLKAAFSMPSPSGSEETGPAGLRRIVRTVRGSRLNLAPSLSPDGSRLVFLSERDRFSVDVYLADARTGVVQRKLVSTATDPHFDSLQFIESAGAWSADGRFALAAVTSGRPVLVILDLERGTAQREIRFDGLGQIFHPTWSPDGRQIAFSGLEGGLSDLYVYDLEGNELRRLTSDAYTDLQPSWSPDGRRIAFVTDRFSTDIRALRFGDYRLALLDVESGNVRSLAGTPSGRSVDPQWSPDSGSLYFRADGDGVTNVFRLELAGGRLYRLTDVATGVSGITHLSPALSVARTEGTVAFSLYDDGNYEIWCLDAKAASGRLVEGAALAGASRPARGRDPQLASGGLGDLLPVPPLEPLATVSPDRADGKDGGRRPVAGHGGSAPLPSGGSAALPREGSAPMPREARDGAAASDLTVKKYQRSLSLDGMGQPYFSAGGGQFGSFFRAGFSFSLGDMLRDQVVDTAVQVGRRAEDFAGRLIYLNRRARWNWGARVEYLPLTFAQSDLALEPDTGHVSARIDYHRQVHRGAAALASYAFNRAERLEVSAGFRSIGFERELQTLVTALSSGRTVSEARHRIAGPRPVGLVETGIAFVHDTAVLGPTSPILGSRARFELSPSLGSLSFATVLADYRKYFVPAKPFTLAVRARYLGRFGAGARDGRLLPLVLGLRDDVRGYDLGSVLGAPCSAEEMALGCSALDRLGGSRLLVANAEVRFPLVGVFSREFEYGKLPIEGLVFADAGSLWREVARPDGTAPQRYYNRLRSVGAGIRVNAGGMVFEFDAVRPFDRQGGGWRFFFNLMPGF